MQWNVAQVGKHMHAPYLPCTCAICPTASWLGQHFSTSGSGVLGSGQSSGVLAMTVSYVGVSKPNCRAIGWVAQNKRRGLWKSKFKNAEQAATWLAKQLGVRLSSLARTACKKTPALAESRVHGVVAKKRPRRRVLWETRVEGQPRRSFASPEAALRVVARARRVNARSLAKKRPTRLHSRRQFQKAYRVFKKYVPGDLMHTRQQEVECEQQFKRELCHTWV